MKPKFDLRMSLFLDLDLVPVVGFILSPKQYRSALINVRHRAISPNLLLFFLLIHMNPFCVKYYS